jgi:hypothetical protein
LEKCLDKISNKQV